MLCFPEHRAKPDGSGDIPSGPRPAGKARRGTFALSLRRRSPSEGESALQGPTLGAFLVREKLGSEAVAVTSQVSRMWQ